MYSYITKEQNRLEIYYYIMKEVNRPTFINSQNYKMYLNIARQVS